MSTLLLTLAISFFLVIAAIFTISYCKRRMRHGKHGLTGMCHESGGVVCRSCSGTSLPTQGGEVRRVCADKTATGGDDAEPK